ncbi:MAG: DNA-3-methyladenine glycosylase 2 family protein [Ktedonobacteraceae bacterium]
MNYETSIISLPVRSPFRLDLTAWALRRRKTNIIDRWDGSQYTRVIVFNNTSVKITVIQEGTVAEPKLNIILQSEKEFSPQIQKDVQLLIQKILGLTIDLQPFYTLVSTNDILKPLVDQFLGVKPPRFPSIFEGLINSIACQQVTLDVGILMINRLSEKFGMKFIDNDKIIYAFPRPEDIVDISEEKIKELGFSYQKSHAIKELATAFLNKKRDLTVIGEMTNEEVVSYLSMIRGIGRWSAEYVLLRGLGRLDTFPGDDIGAQNNLKRLFLLDNKPNYEEIKKLTSQWHPYEGLVYFHLLLEKLHLKGII